MSRWVLVATCALCVALAACRLDATLTISMASSGHGVLRLEAVADRELVERATRFGGTDPIADFRASDLEAGGWKVTRDARARRITLEHGFRTPEELTGLLATLDPGAAQPVLRDFRARRDHGVFSDTYTLTGRVDLTGGGISEPLAQLLQGTDPAVVAAIAGADLSRSFGLRVEVFLPGEVRETTSSEERSPLLVWPVDAGERADVSVVTHRRNLVAVAAAAAAGVLVLAAVVLSVGVAGAARRRR